MKLIVLFKISVLMLVFYGLGIGSLHAHKTIETPVSQEKLLIEVLDEISQEHQVYFTYDSDIIKGVTVEYEKREGESVHSILSRVLAEVNMDFKIFEQRFVILYSKDEAGLQSLEQMISHMESLVKDRKEIFANRRAPAVARLSSDKWSDVNRKRMVLNVTGRVMDAKGESLIGVNVLVKGTNKGTSTDIDGRFSFSDIDDQAVLVVSYIGYRNQEVGVGGQTSLTIVMQEDVQTLDEVVVVGYGSVKKENLTGAVSKIDSDNLTERMNTTLSESFAGQISGVVAKQVSARPGAPLDIIIRGRGSVNSSSQPLYIVDGIPNGIMDINPNDVESIEILKDAASTAIYGARGSNGVVLITTKQGQSGKMKMDFSYNFAIQEAERLIDMMDRDEFIAYSIWGKNAAYIQSGGSLLDPMESRPSRLQYPDSWENPENLPNINWQKAITEQAPIHNYQLSINGGGENGTFLLSGQHLDQKGIIKESRYQLTNFRVNTTLRINQNLSAGLNIAPSFSITKDPQSEGQRSAFHHAIVMPPIVALDKNTIDNGFTEGAFNFVNPLVMLRETKNELKRNSISNNLWLEYKYIDLKFRSQLGYNYGNTEYMDFIPINASAGFAQSKGSNSQSSGYNLIFQNTVSYDTYIRSFMNLNMLLGQSIESNKSSFSSISATQFPNDLIYTLNVASKINSASTTETENSLSSYFGRLTLNLLDKYLITANIRRDGSSKFGRKNRWGWFPSISAGWKIDREKFLKDVSFIDLLKIRASIGRTGSDRIGNYSSIPLLSVSNYSLNNGVVNGLLSSTSGNSELEWETLLSHDFGVDFNTLNNRVQISINYYNNITTNMLFSKPVSSITGFESTIVNLGKVLNRGFELDLSFINVSKNNFTWQTSLNLSTNRNEVLELDGSGTPIILPGNFGGDTYITTVGEPIGSFMGFKTNGVLVETDFDNNGDPLVPILKGQIMGNEKLIDINSDGIINESDRTLLGNSQPDFIWGLNNRLKFKSFNLNFLIHGSQGATLYSPNQVFMSFGQVQGMNSTSNWVNSWKPSKYPDEQNPFPNSDVDLSWDGKTPLSYSVGGAIPFSSDRYFHDATFVRLKNISLSYDLPKNILSRLSIAGLQVNIILDNVYTWTSYPWTNPEANGLSGTSDSGAPGAEENPLKNGTDWGAYPLMRKYSIGINLTL